MKKITNKFLILSSLIFALSFILIPIFKTEAATLSLIVNLDKSSYSENSPMSATAYATYDVCANLYTDIVVDGQNSIHLKG